MKNLKLERLSISTLKSLLRTANPELARRIKAELNCRGIYSKSFK